MKRFFWSIGRLLRGVWLNALMFWTVIRIMCIWIPLAFKAARRAGNSDRWNRIQDLEDAIASMYPLQAKRMQELEEENGRLYQQWMEGR